MKKNLMLIIIILIIVLVCFISFKDKKTNNKKKEDQVVYKDEYILDYKLEQKSNKINNHTITYKRNIVKVTNKAKPKVAKHIEDLLKDFSENEWEQLVGSEDSVTKDSTKELMFRNIYNNKNYLSFIKEYKENDKTIYVNTYTFETKVGAIIKIKSLTDRDEELYEIIDNETINKLEKMDNLDKNYMDYLESDYFNNYTLDDKNLTIYINKENISSESGIIEVKIDKDNIRKLLKEEYR